MKTVRIIIIEDHYLIRLGLRNTFLKEDFDLKVEVVGEAANAKQLYTILEEGLEADLLLLDIKLPDESGIEIAKRISIEYPYLKILILSAENSDEIIEQLLSVKINGFISKGGTPKELFRAIDSVTDGFEYYGKDIATLMHNIKVARIDFDESQFTTKEIAVIKLAAKGLYSKEIADELDMSPKTVSVHKSNIFRKLGINNTAELVRYAIKMGFVRV